MEHIVVEGARPYTVHVGSGVLADFVPPHGSLAVVADATVARLHGARLSHLDARVRLEVEPGEAAKTFAGLEALLEALAAGGLDRDATVLGFGGGAACDVSALAASLYMRGVEFVACPTTLLAMVDASVGGKTAINLSRGKNLAGTFHPPVAVHADLDTLATLPPEELASGLGEVVKSALIGDPALLDLLAERGPEVLAGDPELLGELVARCVRVKAAVVARDERETKERRVLNLGHTFGHAIEQVAGPGAIPHGVAVAAGLGLALEASAGAGLLTDSGLPERVGATLAGLGLPRNLDELRARSGLALPAEALEAAMGLDKKGRGGVPRFVLLRAAAEPELDVELDPALLGAILSPAGRRGSTLAGPYD